MDNLSPEAASVSQFDPSALESYQLDEAFDEMFAGKAALHPHYEPLLDHFSALPPMEIQRRKQAADLSFLNQGITFTVYGRDEGTERIFPYDLLPRIITSAEWATVERGLTQRITALNLFLKDIYTDGRILADGMVPRELGLLLPAVPAADDRAAGATQRVRRGLRNRPDPHGERRLRGARRQPARAVRCELHAHQPPRHEAHLPAALPALQREADRALHAGAAGNVALAGARRQAGPEHRPAVAGRVQLGLLRARLPGAADGHRAGRRPRPRGA